MEVPRKLLARTENETSYDRELIAYKCQNYSQKFEIHKKNANKHCMDRFKARR